MKSIFHLAVLTLPLFSHAAYADQWNFKDPHIAAATLGMLSPMLDEKFCPNIHINQKPFLTMLNKQKFLPEDVQNQCIQCYQNGVDGAANFIKQKGQQGYCDSMLNLFGPKGNTFQGLIQ